MVEVGACSDSSLTVCVDGKVAVAGGAGQAVIREPVAGLPLLDVVSPFSFLSCGVTVEIQTLVLSAFKGTAGSTHRRHGEGQVH